jgi:hypothetical protein
MLIELISYIIYTHCMSIRLQVVMESTELDAIRAAARDRGMTVSEWVRETLREARRKVSDGDAERKLAAIRAADHHAYPTADIDQMVAEIERGYGEANPDDPD